MEKNYLAETALRISGVNPRKCMKCGKCAGACPNFDRMEWHPYDFPPMVEYGLIEILMASKSLYECLSCMACVERCPRGVAPGKLIEAVRLMKIRQQGQNHKDAKDIPAFADENVPQQLLMAAMRKYKK